MKVCVLEICPKEPNDNHKNIFSDNRVDYFYVSYKENSENAIKFNKNKSWGFNRNALFNHVKGKYDYYFFIDYDIILESKSDENPLDLILRRLKELKPAMYRPSGFNGEMKLANGISVGGFINHSVTILDKSVADYVFDLPVKYGGFWDAASYLNNIVVPAFEEAIYVDYDIIAHNTESSGYAQNKIPFIGVRAVNKLFKVTKKYFTSQIPDVHKASDLKIFYDQRRRIFDEKGDKCDISNISLEDYLDIEGLKKELKLV